MNYSVELLDEHCDLIVAHCMIFGTLKTTLKRLAKKSGMHKVNMSIQEMEDIAGWLAAEANHCDDSVLEIKLDELCEKFESDLFSAKG